MVKKTGRLGKLLVEQQLRERGWYPVRLDTAQMAVNANIVALNRERRVSLQVKTTDAKTTKHSHSNSVSLGYAKDYLCKGKPIFNSKPSPVVADVVIGVNYGSENSRFIVMPVAFAEKLCRFHCDYLYSAPLQTTGGKRSPSFHIYLRFAAGRSKVHEEHNEKISRNILAFEDRWDILSEPVNKLHDEEAWHLLD